MNQLQCVLNPWMGLLLCYAKLCHASVSGISSKSSVSCPKKLWSLYYKVHSFKNTNMQKLQCYKVSHSCTRLMLCPWCARIYSSSHDPGYLAEPFSRIWSHHFIPTLCAELRASFISLIPNLFFSFFSTKAHISCKSSESLLSNSWVLQLESIELFDIKHKSCCVVPLAVKYSNSSICRASAPPPANQPNGDQHRCKPCTQIITPCTDHLYSSLWQHHASFLLTGQSETYMVNKSMHVSGYLARLNQLAMYCNLVSHQCNFFCCALRYR